MKYKWYGWLQVLFVIWNKNGSKQTCDKVESKRCFDAWKQGLGIILSLVDTRNINNHNWTHRYFLFTCYSEPFSRWITNTNPLRRAIKAHLKVRIPHLGHPALSLWAPQNSTKQTPQFYRDIQHKEQLMANIPKESHTACTLSPSHHGTKATPEITMIKPLE